MSRKLEHCRMLGQLHLIDSAVMEASLLFADEHSLRMFTDYGQDCRQIVEERIRRL